ncbi:2-oxoglutarate dehydrogenase E1 component [candidate division KSB1 bacterium]
MDKFSYFNNIDSSIIEDLYISYKKDPGSIEESWRKFFEGFEFAHTDNPLASGDSDYYPSEFKVVNLINAYRERGHLFTKTNPVRVRRQYKPTLDIENFSLSESDLKKVYHAGNQIGIGKSSLDDIINHLKQTYCKSVGVEYRYIRNTEIRDWLCEKMEQSKNTPDFSKDKKKHILQKLTEAVLLEKFIHKKFPGQKRFSLEGAESMIPALDAVIENGALMGIKEFVIGMPHRGRLNVLTNILHKSYQDVFSEFEGIQYDDDSLLGDVKYHLGYTSTYATNTGKKVTLTLSPNPSHLEAVNPVVEGIARAKIDHEYNGDYKKLSPILIHGDASFAGQGINYEVLQMSELPGYKTGGTIHLIINNQLGFTTNYLDGRSSTYCTDVGKIIQSPIFHVNGDDVEAVVYTIELAMEFRETFNKDVIIDILCYRKYGHNESDEPRFTQPVLYKIIEKHPNPLEIYIKKLLKEGSIEEIDATQTEDLFIELLEKDLTASKQIKKAHISYFLEKTWKKIKKAKEEDFIFSPETSVKKEILLDIARKITQVSPEISLFRKTDRLLNDRWEMVNTKDQLDWAMGELLAYGSLLIEGIPVRLSGQDVERGTFSHRHAVLIIEDTAEKYIPLNQLSDNQAKFEIYNSLLSEFGVLGFEYGYSLTTPYTLTIWEAQFGDFSNGAQIIIDQFIASAEDKWNNMNDLVLYLPHGYEGQGPEHSSARIERFLSLCAHNNMQVVNCTTPANFFHVLRRQLYRDFRKPLIIFTPKSLLRHPLCVSSLSEFTNGGFKELFDDTEANPNKVDRIIFCSGKIYYDLIANKEKTKVEHTAFIRLEQLYPLPKKQINSIINKYHKAKRYLWVQEEPENMGPWPFISQHLHDLPVILFAARASSGSPATGSSQLHKIRHQKVIDKALGSCTCEWAHKECDMHCVEKEWEFLSKIKA